MRVLMIAPPGTGKGTQGALIAAHFDILHIVTGELLRDPVARRNRARPGRPGVSGPRRTRARPGCRPFSARVAVRGKLPFPVHSKVVLTGDGVVLSFVPGFHSVQPCELL